MKSKGNTHTRTALPFLKGERSESRGGNGEPLLWLITQQGPGRTQCHFHCQTHYTTEEDSPLPPLLQSCVESLSAFPCMHWVGWAHRSERARKNMLNTQYTSSHYAIYCYSGKMHNSAIREELAKNTKSEKVWDSVEQRSTLEISSINTKLFEWQTSVAARQWWQSVSKDMEEKVFGYLWKGFIILVIWWFECLSFDLDED